jgi:signal transduction histidine kinase
LKSKQITPFLTLFIFSLGIVGCVTAPSNSPSDSTSPSGFFSDQTFWFSVLLFAGMFVAATVYRLRVKSLQDRSRDLEQQVLDRTQTLEDQTRQLEERSLESERQRRQLVALYRADEQLHRSLGLDEVLQSMVDNAIDILHADKGVLLVQDDKNGGLRVVAAHGFQEETIKKVDIALGHGIAGIVAETGEPIIVEDVDLDERVSREIVDAEGIRSFIQVPIKIAGELYGVLSADYTSPQTFGEAHKRLLVALAQRAGLAIRNARLYEDTRNRLAQVAALQETTRAIASTLDLDHLLNIIIQQATTLLEADGGIINLVDWERMEDDVAATAGVADGTLGMSGPLEDSISGWVTLNNEAVITNNVAEDPRVDNQSREFILAANLSCAAIAPLTIKDRVMGTIVVAGTEEGKCQFEQSELQVLVAFANQAAIAIENARLYEQARQLAVVEERQRLARELHDSVTQALYGMTLYAEAMARQLDSDKVELAKEQLQELQNTAQEALREMRLLIFQLRPPDLEKDGLVTVLRNRLEAVEARAGLNMEFRVDHEVRLPLEIEEGLYRIAQEALNNTLKHAASHEVVVSLITEGPTIVLEIRDDGIGFDPEAGLQNAGLGLDGMYERAAEIGGKLMMESTPNAGSTIRVEVPR